MGRTIRLRPRTAEQKAADATPVAVTATYITAAAAGEASAVNKSKDGIWIKLIGRWAKKQAAGAAEAFVTALQTTAATAKQPSAAEPNSHTSVYHHSPTTKAAEAAEAAVTAPQTTAAVVQQPSAANPNSLIAPRIRSPTKKAAEAAGAAVTAHQIKAAAAQQPSVAEKRKRKTPPTEGKELQPTPKKQKKASPPPRKRTPPSRQKSTATKQKDVEDEDPHHIFESRALFEEWEAEILGGQRDFLAEPLGKRRLVNPTGGWNPETKRREPQRPLAENERYVTTEGRAVCDRNKAWNERFVPGAEEKEAEKKGTDTRALRTNLQGMPADVWMPLAGVPYEPPSRKRGAEEDLQGGATKKARFEPVEFPFGTAGKSLAGSAIRKARSESVEAPFGSAWSWEIEEEEEAFHARPSIKLNMPDHIKSALVDDWENVTKNQQLVPLPHPHPVKEILEDYLAFERPKREEGTAERDILEETVSGLEQYFNKCLGRILLYRFERKQYADFRAEWDANPDGPHTSPWDTYGVEHFCRLLVTLPELVAQTNMDQQSVNRLREEMAKLTAWVSRNTMKYFVADYESPGQDYINQARVS